MPYLVPGRFGRWRPMADPRWQFSAGIVLAIAFSVPALIAILKLDFFLSFKTLLLALTQRVNLNGWRPLGFGLCAGIGEELLFRGAIQPLLGIWWTGLLFALAHYGTGGFQIHEFHEVGLRGVLISHVADAGACTDSDRPDRSRGAPFRADAVIFFVLRGCTGVKWPDLGGSSSVPEGSVSGVNKRSRV